MKISLSYLIVQGGRGNRPFSGLRGPGVALDRYIVHLGNIKVPAIQTWPS